MLRSLKWINRAIELGNSFIKFPYNFKTRKDLKLNSVLPSVAFSEINVRNFQTPSFINGILGILLPSNWITKRRTRLIPSTKFSFKIRISDFETKRARSCTNHASCNDNIVIIILFPHLGIRNLPTRYQNTCCQYPPSPNNFLDLVEENLHPSKVELILPC